MEFVALDHVQLAIPPGGEDLSRTYYIELLGLTEIPKPPELAKRGGYWADTGRFMLHFGVDHDFRPATKAHPAMVVDDLDALGELLTTAGHPLTWLDDIPEVQRFETWDPHGNRLEFIAAATQPPPAAVSDHPI